MEKEAVTRRTNVSRSVAIASLVLSRRWHNSDFSVFRQLVNVVMLQPAGLPEAASTASSSRLGS